MLDPVPSGPVLPAGALRTTVVSVASPTPGSRRITLGGEALRGFALPRGCWGPYLKLLFPRPDGSLAWRTYSVRAFDPESCELAVEIMLHEPRGIGASWAMAAGPGDALAILGPGVIPVPPAPDWIVLAGDRTALPAIAYTLEQLPAATRGLALIAVEDAADRQDLAGPPGVEVRWVEGDLADAVLGAPWPCEGDCVLWAGAEAGAARRIRAYARKRCGLDACRRPILNYWKRGQAEGSFDCQR
ncbi:siderophore-interacting protein [Lichenibacterium dinghuense]|uniref:siderophore-interacting protein n=1 Tax=Lichenibacterium dinghuense TaxID=2895977 RepID=UPI001F445AC3|nr:siderophore-interacting protein [Lichenibacterium sp. 6Y81]